MVKIKVCHLTYDMRIGGTETVIKNLVEGMNEQSSHSGGGRNLEFESEILCLEPNLGPFGEQLQEQGIKITNLHWTSGFDLKLIKRIRAYIKENNVDVLHCHQYTPWVYGAMAAAFTKVKVIFTEHGRFYPDSSNWKRRYINPVLLKFTDHVTAISKATKQALVDYEFIPENCIEVIYNGIKPLVADPKQVKALRQDLNIPEDASIVGTVARLDPIKNQTMMIEAFSLVLKEHPNIYLLIVGDGEERQRLEKLVDELKIRQNVIFTGYVAKPVNHIALMDIFLLSSLSEGTSMTLLEAMSLSKPCVVTDVGGNSEVIKCELNGVVTPSYDKTSFSKGVLNIILSSERNKHLSKGANDTFNSKFISFAMKSNYEKLYCGK